jgi:hypothetical protein
MKKYIINLCILAISALFFVNCKHNLADNVKAKNDIELFNHNVPNVKIKEIAAQYGFTKEKLTLKQKSNYKIFSFLDSTYITCCSEESLHKDFNNIKLLIERDKRYEEENAIFDTQKKTITSYKDYFDLINSLPLLKKTEIEQRGGEQLYQNYVDSMVKLPVHVYIGTDSVLTFIPPHLDNGYSTNNGKYPGKRLDNLKF